MFMCSMCGGSDGGGGKYACKWWGWYTSAFVYVPVSLSGVWECVCVCCGTRSQASLVCEVRREKSEVPQHASTSSCSICPFRSVLHKLKTLYICFGVHC